MITPLDIFFRNKVHNGYFLKFATIIFIILIIILKLNLKLVILQHDNFLVYTIEIDN